MIFAYDDVSLSLIPSHAVVIFAYIDGDFANYHDAVRRFPSAKVLSVSVGSGVPADLYDFERGDYSSDHWPELFATAHKHGIWRPGAYASLDVDMPAIVNWSSKNLNRQQYRLLVADYTGQPHIPQGYDGCQYTDKAQGRSLDESLLLDTFLPAARPSSHRLDAAHVSFDPVTGTWRIRPLPFEALN